MPGPQPLNSRPRFQPSTAMQDAPSAVEFADQLIRQVLGDLDAFITTPPQTTALDSLIAEAAAGRSRGASLLLLARAASMSLRALTEAGEPTARPEDADAAVKLVQALVKKPLPIAELQRHTERMEEFVADSEPTAQGPVLNLARAVVRLYAGLQNNDEQMGGRGLIELRSLVMHLDAVASVLSETGAAEQPVAVLRPDHFHDAFMHLTEQIRAGGGSEVPVATLTDGGKITAVINDDEHPIAAALVAARERMDGSEASKAAAVQRMLGLLIVFEKIRREQISELGSALQDQALYLGVVTAAATAPLTQAGFSVTPLARIARYNRGLFGQQPAPDTQH